MKKSKTKKRVKHPRAFFTQRFAAYFIDMFLITMITSIVTYPFINSSAVSKLSEQSREVMQNYVDQKIDVSTYMSQSIDISFEQARVTGFSSIITITILVLYFIVFQVYQGGQTLGKKMMKIKIVKDDDSILSMNDMIMRGLLNNFILADILIAIITLMGKNAYFYGSSIVEFIQYLFIIITIFMIIIRKDGKGLPDMFVGTQVINLSDEVEEEILCEN